MCVCLDAVALWGQVSAGSGVATLAEGIVKARDECKVARLAQDCTLRFFPRTSSAPIATAW